MMQVPTMKKGSWGGPRLSAKSAASGSVASSLKSSVATSCSRTSAMCIPHSDRNARLPSDAAETMHCEIEFDEEDCAITSERLKRAHDTFCHPRDRKSCMLTSNELQSLQKEQKTIRKTLFLPGGGVASGASSAASSVGGTIRAGGSTLAGGVQTVGKKFGRTGMTIKDQMQRALSLVDEGDSTEEEDDEEGEYEAKEEKKRDDEAAQDPFEGHGTKKPDSIVSNKEHRLSCPADDTGPPIPCAKPSLDKCKTERSIKTTRGMGTVKAQFLTAKLRARLDVENDGVMGVQGNRERMQRFNSMVGNKFVMYNMRMSSNRAMDRGAIDVDQEGGGEGEAKEMDVEDVSYVRKPNLARIIEEYEAMQNHPKYTLKQVVLSRRFHLYAHRFGNAQYQRTLVYPTLRQPEELYTCPWLKDRTLCGECKEEEAPRVTEKHRTRRNGHRFVIAADTQFGILMDGFAMDFPNWSQEIEISRKCVAQINAMTGPDRPLFVCVCGDLVDTESSFSGAIASWKKVMSGWERNLVFEQQVKDFKRVWAQLDNDIALVCLCGNHDVGNRPTRASIKHWTSSFGDDFLSFWVNGSYNVCMNNCLFSNPSGAPDLFDEQLRWLEDRLAYARENDATHIFVYGHFPWFLKHEEEADDFLTSYSAAPAGWGPPGSSFADSYFTIPYETRKIAMELFRKYDVTACFSGHFHQNVVAQTSWGMPMIVTGPLSMNLSSDIAKELSNGETNGIGMRVVDVGERGKFTHKWILLDDADELYESGIKRCLRQSALEDDAVGRADSAPGRNSLFDKVFDKVEQRSTSEVEIQVSSSEAQQWHSTRISQFEEMLSPERDGNSVEDIDGTS